MPGSLGLSTPWTRNAITKDARHDVEAAMPDGWTLGVSMDKNRNQWVFWHFGPGEKPSHQLRVSASMSLASAAFYALRHWKLTRDTVVTVDPEGYVRSLTDAE